MFLFCSHVKRWGRPIGSAGAFACAVYGAASKALSIQPCGYQSVLDMQTLVWAKGRNFPLARLGSRLMCPKCGSKDVNVVFEPPPMVRTVIGGR